MAKNNIFQFYKMNGGGNDFVIFDNRKQVLPADYSALAKKLCDRKFSIGADGLLVLEKEPSADFRMVYYNADGSRADMCGNGARCIARFANLHKAAGNKMNFLTDAGMISADIYEKTVKINLGIPKDLKADFSIKIDDKKEFNASSINTGVPHTMILVKEAERIDVQDLGSKIRYHKDFAPAGTNVNFVQPVDEHNIIVRTYERGVEGETLACGTGVTASAILCGVKELARSPVSCLTRGGDTLQVHFKIDRNDRRMSVTDVYLEGPAKVSFYGEVEI